MSDLLSKIDGLMLAHREDMRSFTYEDLIELQRLARQPIPMILLCPACGLQHVDEMKQCAECKAYDPGDNAYCPQCWQDPPHKSHVCAGCEFQWRPADVNTEGVEAITTRHTNDSPKRFNLHDDLAVIHSLAASGTQTKAPWVGAREALVRIRELSNRAKDRT